MEALHEEVAACFNRSSTPQNISEYLPDVNGSTVSLLEAKLAEDARCQSLIEEYMSMMSINSYVDASQHTRDNITYYLMGIGGMTLCCLGLISNVLSLVVLSHRNMRSSTYSYLAALAVCDSLMLVCTILLLIKDVHPPQPGSGTLWNEGAYPYLFPYVHPLAFTFQVTSIWLTLSFTVDRYIMICHPFRAEPFCTISRARKVIVCLCVASFVFNLPKFFEYETVVIDLPNNTTKVTSDLTMFGRNQTFRELYHSWLYIVFVCGVPFLTLAVLNAFLIHAVSQSRKRGREINAAERKKNDTTVMLIGVVITFFICQMPALVSRILWAFEDNPDTFKQLSLYTLNEIGSFLIVLNSAINIVPYYFFGARFRKHFWRIFCSCLFKYSAFKKITRSFSLTIIAETDNRRGSGFSYNHRCSASSNQPIMLTALSPPYTQDRNHSNKPSSNQIQVHQTSNNGYRLAAGPVENSVYNPAHLEKTTVKTDYSGSDTDTHRDSADLSTYKLLDGVSQEHTTT